MLVCSNICFHGRLTTYPTSHVYLHNSRCVVSSTQNMCANRANISSAHRHPIRKPEHAGRFHIIRSVRCTIVMQISYTQHTCVCVCVFDCTHARTLAIACNYWYFTRVQRRRGEAPVAVFCADVAAAAAAPLMIINRCANHAESMCGMACAIRPGRARHTPVIVIKYCVNPVLCTLCCARIWFIDTNPHGFR